MLAMNSASGQDELTLEVARTFQERCLSCHNDRDLAGGLSLTSGDALLAGGDSGAVIEAEDADASYLVDLITPKNGRADMPMEGPPLSPNEIRAIRQWIQQGAKWPDGFVLQPPTNVDLEWWSLQPLQRPEIPPSIPSQSGEDLHSKTDHPIDAFVLRKLHDHQLTFSAPADRRVLARRLFYDLIGLPPTPEELAEFEADPDPNAYEQLVDRLLASPRYGERWARHWLDVVHYADTHGYDKDKPRENAWPYRDYVIRALNEDKPWSQFVEEQIAGDVLFPQTVDGIEALGFIAAGPWDLIGHEELPESKIDGKVARHLDRDDMVRNAIQSFMSLTVGCAQCHNHKFDPISQLEYFQLQSVFAALDRADRPYDLDPETATRRSELQRAMAELASLRSGLDEDAAEAREIEAQQEDLAKQLFELPLPNYVYAGTVHHGSGNFTGVGPMGGMPREIFLLHRGEVTQQRESVSPGALSLVPGLPADLNLPAEHCEGDRRAALAKWLTHPGNAFTWRSIVNRVWQYHFGTGLVSTSNDFGQMGMPPSHPELLDWLACEFRDQGQSLKKLHRLIVTSHTYCQSSIVDAECDRVQRANALDAENRLLWRANRRKLDAESVHDSVLSISGKLDLTMGGPAFRDFVIERPEHSPQYRYDLHDFHDPRCYRRSVYRFTVRSQLQPFMNALDCADPSQQVANRNEGESPLQALAMLNNGLILIMSQHYAEKLMTNQLADDAIENSEDSLAPKVARAFLETTSRLPNDKELSDLVSYGAKHGLPNLCRVLFNLNEFLFID